MEPKPTLKPRSAGQWLGVILTLAAIAVSINAFISAYRFARFIERLRTPVVVAENVDLSVAGEVVFLVDVPERDLGHGIKLYIEVRGLPADTSPDAFVDLDTEYSIEPLDRSAPRFSWTFDYSTIEWGDQTEHLYLLTDIRDAVPTRSEMRIKVNKPAVALEGKSQNIIMQVPYCGLEGLVVIINGVYGVIALVLASIIGGFTLRAMRRTRRALTVNAG